MKFMARKGQELKNHLLEVAKKAFHLSDNGTYGETVGMLHDIGKYSIAFQKSLKMNTEEDGDEDFPGKPDHSSAGAQLIMSILRKKAEQTGDSEVQRIAELVGRIIAHTIVGHHAGLLNSVGTGNGASLDNRLAKKIEPYVSNIGPEITQRIEELVDNIIKNEEVEFICRWIDSDGIFSGRDAFSLQFAIRMLFSALVDADRLDSERAGNPEQWRIRTAIKTDSLQVLQKRLEDHLITLSSSGIVNEVRKEVSQQCKDTAKSKPGFFELTVPTGGGKTLASLRFALHHAQHGMERVIYVMPYTTIIEQNADVFRKILDSDNRTINVLEHHSNIEPVKETLASKLLAENWSSPIVVTTSVQFFELLYTAKPSWCRRLHSVRRSVIILDEAQNVPVRYLKAIMWALEELVTNYGCTVVFCTATQPIFDSKRLDAKKTDNHRVGIKNIRSIVKYPHKYFTILKRVEVHPIESDKALSAIDISERVAEKAYENKSILCIVNTKRNAKTIFKELKKKEDLEDSLWHLSTSMCPQHRKDVIEIVKLLAFYGRKVKSKTPIVVSTQIVEAGVNLDFDVVFRAIAGIDSITQAAGRCNREGKMTQLGQVYFFEAEENLGDLRDIIESQRIAIDTLSALDSNIALTKTEKDPIGLKAIEEYFKRMYWSRASEMDSKDIIARLASPRKLEEGSDVAFTTISQDFRIIEKDTVSVIVPYGDEGKSLVKMLYQGDELGFDEYKLAGRYSVQVFKDSLPKFNSFIFKSKSGWLILINEKCYGETGLIGPDELSMEDYIV
ncbi:MAG: hypothetical protein A2Y10_12990 [Planctomycetes bacterium GWF2_41_51]|nr:MAG: hypothetical protein A2Y10_12990 [Planctomycetes bacterium GWF2_41_51]